MSRVTNLTKQKQLQEALRESEQRYQKLLESVTDCIYTVKVKGGRAKDANTSRSAIATYYSPSCVAVTGYTAAEYAADPQLWDRMIYEEDREAVRQQVAKILSGETAPSLEHRIVHKDGSIRWVRNTPVVHQDKQGRIVSYQALIKDITERKKAEEALREREHFIQRVAEAMPGLLYVYDLIEQCNVYVNRRQISEILGYSPEAVQAMGAKVLPTLIHPDDLPKIAAYHQQFATVQDGEVIELEYRMRDANGEWHWLLSRDIVFARTADGSVQQVLGTATDITHLKQVEEELRQSEERFRVALKNAPIVVFNQDTELRYTWIYNPLPGANVEDVVGKLDAELVTAEDAQRLTAIKRQVLTGGVGRRLEESLTINGDVRYYDLTVEPMRDRCGEIVGITCVALDISDAYRQAAQRKRTEEALRESQRLFEQITETVPGVIYIYDLSEERNIYINHQVRQILGYTPEEIQTFGSQFLPGIVHPDDFVNILASYEHLPTLADGEIRKMEYRMRHANGEWRWLLSRDTVFSRNPDGLPKQLLGAAQDITEHKQAEEALLEAKQELEIRVRERTHELSNAISLLRLANSQLRQELVERKRIELALRESQERYALAISSGGVAVWDWNLETNEIYLDPTWKAMLGYADNEISNQVDDLSNLVHPDDRERVASAVDAHLQGLTPELAIEHRMFHNDGSVRWILVRGTAIRDASGKPYRMTGTDTDITQRKQIETALRESEQRLQALLDNSTAVIYAHDTQDRYVLINRTYENLFHITKEEIVGKSVYDIWPREIADVFVANNKKVLEAKAPLEFEEVAPHADGLHTYIAIKFALYDADGVPYAVCGMSTDITERKQAEETIKQQAQWERLLGTIVHHIRQSLNLDRILATTVTEVRQLLQADRVIVFRLCPDGVGRTIAEAVAPGQPTFIEEQFPDETFPEECYEFYRQGNVRIVPEIEKDEVASCLIEFFRELGVKSKLVVPLLQDTSVWGVLSAHYCTESPRQWQDWEIELLQRLAGKVAIAIQQAELYQKVQTELIERKRAEKELRTNQQRQAVLLRSVPVVLYTARTFGDFGATWVSENIEQLSGFSSHQLIDDPSFWASRIHPEDREWVLQETSALIGIQAEIATEYRWQCADGTYRWFLDRAVLIPDEEGKPTEVIGSFVDITQLKQAEEEIRKALAQEKELNELKSRFINMASHEFRTPLSAILSSADLLEYYIQEGAAEKQLEHIQRIQTSCVNMTELLNDILMIGRAEAGKLDFQPSLLNLTQLCGNLVEELQLSLDSKHKLTFVNQCHCISACMDEKLLRHILTNLLSNAIKYSPKGGNIQLKLFCQDGAAVFQIQDEGIGIPKEDQPRLFESFHRARNVGTIPGTGLGLAIVKRSIDLHGGQVAIESEVGVGTIVTCTLPLNGCSQTDEEDSGD